jgi:Mn-dependent DtxR family transcriptional regulator
VPTAPEQRSRCRRRIRLGDLCDQLRVDQADVAVLLEAMEHEVSDETADELRGLLDPGHERTRS